MIRRRHLLATAAGAALPALAPAADRPLLFNSFLPSSHPLFGRVLKPWADEVAKATSGRVSFDTPAGSVAPPPQQMDAAAKGIIDVGYQFLGNLSDRIKLPQMTNLPLLHTEARASSVALWRTHARYFASAAEFRDVHLLGLWVMYPATVFAMKRPIAGTEDLKGLKVWSTPGFPSRVLEGIGASVVATPAVRSYEIISAGTVDAFASYAVSDAAAFNTLQYAKQVLDLPGHLQAPSFALFISKRAWSRISPQDQQAVTALSGEALATRLSAFDEIEAKARQAALAQGIRIEPAGASVVDAVRRAAAPLEQAWLADATRLGVDGKAALAFYRQEASKA